MTVRKIVVITGIAIGVGCLLAGGWCRQRARRCADEIVGGLPVDCAYLSNRMGGGMADGERTVGWVVSYDLDVLGPGPIQVNCSVWGDFRSTSPGDLAASAEERRRR